MTEQFQAGAAAIDPPWEILDENRWLAARHGLEGRLYDFDSGQTCGVLELTEALLERLVPHARALGCEEQLLGVHDCWARATARRASGWSMRPTTTCAS